MIDLLELSLVVPVHDEEESVEPFLNRFDALHSHCHWMTTEFRFVKDGSRDATMEKRLRLQARDRRIRVVDLSRNFGKEAALTAGLAMARGRVIVPIDVDLQDPPELILPMIEKWREGYDVVLAYRMDRVADTWPKRLTANGFYKIHNAISEPRLPENVGDFRLMDRRVVDAINLLPESRRFMKGIFAWVGFRTAVIDFSRPQRKAGRTKFNGWKLWNFAIEGFTSFSTVPLRVWTYVGTLVAQASFLFAIFIAVRVFIQGVDVPGYPSLMVAITFLGGLQLIGIGILGEYLGRTYFESKRRPTYLIRSIYEGDHENGSEGIRQSGKRH
jgi:glycosyltransferase involved in cell wall biosynthesis